MVGSGRDGTEGRGHRRRPDEPSDGGLARRAPTKRNSLDGEGASTNGGCEPRGPLVCESLDFCVFVSIGCRYVWPMGTVGGNQEQLEAQSRMNASFLLDPKWFQVSRIRGAPTEQIQGRPSGSKLMCCGTELSDAMTTVFPTTLL